MHKALWVSTCTTLVMSACSVTRYPNYPYDPNAYVNHQPAIDVIVGAGSLPETWETVLSYCEFREEKIRQELSDIKGKQSTLRWFWGGLTTLLSASTAVYGLVEGEGGDARVGAILGLSAGLTAIPTFLTATENERRQELEVRLAEIAAARGSVRDNHSYVAGAGQRWNTKCSELRSRGVKNALLTGSYVCFAPDQLNNAEYTGDQDATPREVNELNELVGTFRIGQVQLGATLSELDQACRR